MPRKFLMSWEGKPGRWQKMYRGQRYSVYCSELGTPKSKDESYQKANEWWLRKKLEIDRRHLTPDHEAALRELDHRIKWAERFEPSLLPDLNSARLEILGSSGTLVPLPDQNTIEQNLMAAHELGIRVSEFTDDLTIQEFFGEEKVWRERFQRTANEPDKKTIGECLALFLNEVKEKQKPATYREISRYLKTILDKSGFITSNSSPDLINESLVTTHSQWLSSFGYGSEHHNKRLSFFRRFVTWLYQNAFIDTLPRNLTIRTHKKKTVVKKIETYESKIVSQTILALPDRFKLWALLCLNTGMTSVDLGSLTWDMVDLKENVLTRRRVKTGDLKTTPTVRYKLWPEVVVLLSSLPTKQTGGLVFVTRDGKQMYDSRFTTDDNVLCKNNFSMLWSRRKLPMSLKAFRSIGSTALKTSPLYRQYVELYLGHSTKSIADKHYSAESDKPFWEALDHIHHEIFGSANPTKPKSKTPVVADRAPEKISTAKPKRATTPVDE